MWQFKSITGNVFKTRTVFVDNFVFRLHYRITFWLLVIGCTLVSARQYIGEHIHCIADKRVAHVINTYCFFSTTFTVVKHHNNSHAAHPGVGPYVPGDKITHHAYYQWVPFVLFGQALTFYLGHFIWKNKEKGRVKSWAENPVPPDEAVLRLHVYRDWAKWLVTCEMINLINLFVQVYLTDLFLAGRFLSLGTSSPDALDDIFPKVTKCTFRHYGPSGTIQVTDSLCVIALNIVNEKIYWVLWLWYVALAIVSIVGLVWRAVTVMFHSHSCLATVVWSRLTPGSHVPRSVAYNIALHSTFSDWLLIYYLSKNMKPSDFRQLIDCLSKQLSPRKMKFDYPSYSKETEKLKLDSVDKTESDC